jgi:selenocysteine lyase/cysteine desulfurase
MIYLDNGATSFRKPVGVYRAVDHAMRTCANPGRGGYAAAMTAADTVFRCRERAAELFECQPEQVIFTSNCTHGLNIAIRSLFRPGSRVVISGFEHNAVTRPLHLLGARVRVAGRKLFDPADTLQQFEDALRAGTDGAVFTHVSNVFGYILPVEEMAALCRKYGVPFIVDAAQSAGALEVKPGRWGADFVAMPGHKGLLGPQGTGLLLCAGDTKPLLAGGTGSNSLEQEMPDFLPDRLEAGTLNVPGIAGLSEGLAYLLRCGTERIFQREHQTAVRCVRMLQRLGYRVFAGENQAGTVSFLPKGDCEEMAHYLAGQGIAVRAGLHCAPLAHESAGTLQTGTVRVSFGHDAGFFQCDALEKALRCAGKN